MKISHLILIPALPILFTACGGSGDGAAGGPALTPVQRVEAQLSNFIGTEINEIHPDGHKKTVYISGSSEPIDCVFKQYRKKRVLIGANGEQALYWTQELKKRLDTSASDARCKEEVSRQGEMRTAELSEGTFTIDSIRQSCQNDQRVTCEQINEVQVNGQTGFYVKAKIQDSDSGETINFETTAVPSPTFEILDFSPYSKTKITRENGEILRDEYVTATINQRSDFTNSKDKLLENLLDKSLVEQGQTWEMYSFKKLEDGSIEAGQKQIYDDVTMYNQNNEAVKCSYTSHRLVTSVMKFNDEDHMFVVLTYKEVLDEEKTDERQLAKCKDLFSKRTPYPEIFKATFVTDKVIELYRNHDDVKVYDIK